MRRIKPSKPLPISNGRAVRDVIRNHPLPAAAQQAVVGSGNEEWLDDLLRNQTQTVADEVFNTLLSQKLGSDTALLLARHADTPTRVDAFIDVEKRIGPSLQIIQGNAVSSEQFERLIANIKKPSSQFAAHTLHALKSKEDFEISTSTRLKLANAANPTAFVREIGRQAKSAEDVTRILDEFEANFEAARKDTKVELDALLNDHPKLLEDFISRSKGTRSVAAGSHLLHSQEIQDELVDAALRNPLANAAHLWSLLALAANPRATSETLGRLSAIAAEPDSDEGAGERVKSKLADAVSHASERGRHITLTPLAEISDEEHLRRYMKRNAGGYAIARHGERLALLRNEKLEFNDVWDILLVAIPKVDLRYVAFLRDVVNDRIGPVNPDAAEQLHGQIDRQEIRRADNSRAVYRQASTALEMFPHLDTLLVSGVIAIAGKWEFVDRELTVAQWTMLFEQLLVAEPNEPFVDLLDVVQFAA